jgi:hypothetical protein
MAKSAHRISRHRSEFETRILTTTKRKKRGRFWLIWTGFLRCRWELYGVWEVVAAGYGGHKFTAHSSKGPVRRPFRTLHSKHTTLPFRYIPQPPQVWLPQSPTQPFHHPPTENYCSFNGLGIHARHHETPPTTITSTTTHHPSRNTLPTATSTNQPRLLIELPVEHVLY